MNESTTLSLAPTRREALLGAALTFGTLACVSADSDASVADGLSHSAEAIHQEVTFKASRTRVYAALTDAVQFEQVTQRSEAVRSGMALGSQPTAISRDAGGAFTLFGGYILGRQIELVPDVRVVQAWRETTWEPGVYSIARFELMEHDGGTRLVFDHTGFPAGAGAHLAAGWKSNYWEPLAQFLA